MTYKLCKRLIENGIYEHGDMLQKLDVFLLNNRITQGQYEELTGMIPKEPTKEEPII